MASTLAWLDHDATARDRTRRILALFQEKRTVDQLGLGGIRDTFADLLFPGTSTIQTRLRYFLFVPWIYRRLEEDQVPASQFGAAARERELALVQPLLSTSDEGVFGRVAGGDLKRLPSEIYWGGLGSWGIRRFDASPGQYHRAVDEIYRRRALMGQADAESADAPAGITTWHPELPPPPADFPEQATLDLSVEEAGFLRDRIVAEHPSSLLAWLVLHSARTDVPFAWDHPRAGMTQDDHRTLLRHIRTFSLAMEGAPILYNHMLSMEAGRPALKQRYETQFGQWAALVTPEELDLWSLDEFFRIARRHGDRSITPQAEEFVRRWVALVRTRLAELLNAPEAHSLIRNREMMLKGARSLFRNRRALDEGYSGGLGLGRMTFRWGTVQALLNDLHTGLAAS
jgi:hypothetical protein